MVALSALLAVPPKIAANEPSATPPASAPADSLFSVLESKECGWWDLEFANLLRARPQLASSRNADGETPLHVAARKRHENEVFLLLQAGADVNARDKQGRTPLYLVAGLGHEDARMIRDMLVIKKADIDAPAADGFTPLMIAAREGNVSTVEFLVWLGASLESPKGSDQPSPHALALAGNHIESAALLAPAPEGEAPVTLKSPLRRVPSHVARAFTDAAAKKDYALLVDLIESGVGIDTRDPEQATALHRAVYRAHEDVVTFLLLLGANPNLADRHGNTPYMAASNWFGLSMDWMRAMLILGGGDIHAPLNKRGLSPLGAATASGNEASAQLLIWSGADPAKPCGEEDTDTPMRIACRVGSQRLIDLLRRNGVTEPEFVDPIPQRRLEQYVKRGMEAEVRELVAGGEVSLAGLNERGLTLACEATHARHPDMIRLLLSLGADPKQKNKDGSTLLDATLAWNYHAISRFREELIAMDIDIDSADRNGTTPVMKAARHGANWTGLRQLVDAGADLSARDNKGRTALDLALQSGRPDATRYLLSVNAPFTDPEKVDTTP